MTTDAAAAEPLDVERTGRWMSKTYDVGMVDQDESQNSQAAIVALVGSDKRVLDVGCAAGYIARALVAHGCVVVGVDNDEAALDQARDTLERAVVADLETADLVAELDGDRFEVIVLGDVLEHLTNPERLLRQATRLLVPGGSLVTSVPNVAHGDVRLALYAGQWDYRPAGLLDDTHIRFFTERTYRALLRRCGLAVLEVRRMRLPLFATELGLRVQDFPAEVVADLRRAPDHDLYQFVMRSVPDDEQGRLATLAAREWELTQQVGDLEQRVAVLSTQLAAEQEQLQGQAAELVHLRALSGEIAPLQGALAHERRRGAELDQLLQTRTIRWSKAARGVYGRARRLLR